MYPSAALVDAGNPCCSRPHHEAENDDNEHFHNLVSLGVEGLVFPEEFQAGLVVDLGHIITQFLTSSKNVVESVIPEADDSVFLDAAAVVYFADVRPHTGAEAHMAGLAGGVEFAASEVVGAQALARIAYGLYLAVAGSIVVPQLCPCPTTFPSLTITAPKGPPCPCVIPSLASSIASFIY